MISYPQFIYDPFHISFHRVITSLTTKVAGACYSCSFMTALVTDLQPRVTMEGWFIRTDEESNSRVPGGAVHYSRVPSFKIRKSGSEGLARPVSRFEQIKSEFRMQKQETLQVVINGPYSRGGHLAVLTIDLVHRASS